MKYAFIICGILIAILISGCIGPDNASMRKDNYTKLDSASSEKNIDIKTENTSIKKDIDIEFNNYSKRIDGTVEITVYKSPDGKSRATIYKDAQPKGFNNSSLKEEIEMLEKGKIDWENEPDYQVIDDHLAISTNLSLVTDYRQKVGVPDYYYTVIAYPEEGYVLAIRTNGDNEDYNLSWDKHKAIVDKYKL